MKDFDSIRTINGTYGEMWFDDDYMAEVEEMKANLGLGYSDVSMVRSLVPGKKLTKVEPKGSFKLHHVRSNIAKKAADMIAEGKTPSFKIISKLADPDAFGAERVALYKCKIDSVTLMDWANGKLTEESYNFTFEKWELMEYINA